MLKLTPVPRTSCRWGVAWDTVEAGRITVAGDKLTEGSDCCKLLRDALELAIWEGRRVIGDWIGDVDELCIALHVSVFRRFCRSKSSVPGVHRDTTSCTGPKAGVTDCGCPLPSSTCYVLEAPAMPTKQGQTDLDWTGTIPPPFFPAPLGSPWLTIALRLHGYTRATCSIQKWSEFAVALDHSNNMRTNWKSGKHCTFVITAVQLLVSFASGNNVRVGRRGTFHQSGLFIRKPWGFKTLP